MPSAFGSAVAFIFVLYILSVEDVLLKKNSGRNMQPHDHEKSGSTVIAVACYIVDTSFLPDS